MVARQTVFRVRSEQTDLSAAVASLLPSEMERARKAVKRSQATRTTALPRTTFCPICGGNKEKIASRCADCRNKAMSEGAADARSHGRFSFGSRNAARALAGAAMGKAKPDHGDYQPQEPTRSKRVRGEGRTHRQAWDRKVLVDGQWIAESQTPEGRERKRRDDEAVRRLAMGQDC